MSKATQTALRAVGLAISLFAIAVPAAQAAFPGQNGRIALAKNRHANFDIYTTNATGGQEARLTYHAAWDSWPTWSPDGTRIAFASGRDDPDGDIYVMNADGTDVRRVTTHSGADISPAWSPDGKQLLFEATRQNTGALYTINVDGSGEAPLPNGNPGSSPAWSATGKIAYVCNGGEYAEICVMNPDGTGQRPITGTSYTGEYDPSWSPDGARIAYVTNSDDVWIIDATGANARNLTQFCCNPAHTAWSPDGKQVIFSNEACTPVDYLCGGDFDIWAIGPDGGARRAVTANATDEFNPDWGPVAAGPRAAAGTGAPAGTSRSCKLRRFLPDRSCTPGATRKASRKAVCRSGRPKPISAALKSQVLARYGISAASAGKYRIDHLVSTSLGGSNSIENLWPQTTGQARRKNKLERRLRAAVCARKLSLRRAQERIRSNWRAAYADSFERKRR
jgi:Tol biopolymer transport system component